VHILQLHNRYRQAGGEDRVVEEEAALLIGSGHRVDRIEALNSTGLEAALDLAFSAWNPRAARRTSRAIQVSQPDVVHVHNTWFALSPAAVAAASRLQKPVVMTLHNYRLACANGLLFRDGRPCQLCLKGSTLNAVRYRCYRGRLVSGIAAANIAFHRRAGTWPRIVDLFVVLSEFARGLAEEMGLPANRIEVKPNSVADPGPRSGRAADSDTLLFVGRLSEEKGISLLLKAWKRARPEGLRLLVIGDGPLGHQMTALPPGVQYAGRLPHDQVLDQMRSARALIFPSQWYEGQPMVLLEALACGLPVLGSAHGGVGELVRWLGESWCVPPASVEGWMAAMRRLDDTVIDQGSGRAREIYLERFASGPAIRRLLRVYQRAIELNAS
jgi:glycosyltransferase involved in cell wall biosynthesis